MIAHDIPAGLDLTQDQRVLRDAVRELCASFGDAYWRELDAGRAYPDAFIRALTEAGYLAALIPEKYGGAGLGIAEACIILEEVNRSGGNAAACHAQMYIMGTVLRHGSEEQKQRYLPRSRAGSCGCKRSASPNPTPEAIRPRSRRPRSGAATRTWSTARKCGPRACSTAT